MKGLVDSHVHLWDPGRRPQPWLDAASLAALRRPFTPADLRGEAGEAVAAAIVVQCLPEVEESLDLLALAAGDPLVVGVIGWVDLPGGRVREQVESLRSAPGGEALVGVRHLVQDEVDPAWLTRPEVVVGLAALASVGLSYDLLVRPHQLPAAATVAAGVPELTMVLDHCAKPPIIAGRLDPWRTQLRRLAREPNVWCKLSGLLTEAAPEQRTASGLAPYVDVVLEAFGPSRVMFGSDWPVLRIAGRYGDWLEIVAQLLAPLAPADRERVLRTNACTAYQPPL